MIRRNIKNPFVISFIFLVFSAVFLSIFFNKISRDSLSEQIQHRQQTAVRAGAKSIEFFLNSIGKASVTLANSPTREKIDEFTTLWTDSNISGLVVTDKNGILIDNSNSKKIRDTTGVDLSDRDYFIWAKTAKKGEYKVFTPVISKVEPSKGKTIVTVSTPIIKNGQFDGALTIAILLSDLTNEYISNLEVLNNSKHYLISGKGILVCSDVPELIGKNMTDIFNNEFLGKKKVMEILLDEQKKDSETKLKLAIPNSNNNYKLEPYLISAAPIHISNQLWKIVVVTPEKDLLSFTYSLYSKQIIAVFIVVTLFILLTLKASKETGYKSAVIDEHKIHGIDEPKV